MKHVQAALFAGMTIVGSSTPWSCRCGHGERSEGAECAESDDGDEEAEEDTREETITLGAAPEAVRTAFAKLAGADRVQKVERITEDDLTSFEIDYLVNGAKSSVTLSERGDVMELEGPPLKSRMP